MHIARSALTKLIQAGLLSVALTGTAFAQMPAPSFSLQHDKPAPTKEELERQKANDKAYKAAVDKIPEKKTHDPWGNIRATAPTTAAKSKP